MTATENKEWEPAGPEGVRGWLVVLIAGLWISAAWRSGAGLLAALPALGLLHTAENPSHAGLLTGLLEVFAGLFASTTAFMLMRRNWRAPELARVFLFINVVFYLASLLWAVKGSGPYVADAIPVWARPAGLLAMSILGFSYAARSRRIANTYSQSRPPSQSHWEETSILPRIRGNNWDERKEAGPAVGLAEQLSMRKEPITADAEARLMNDLKARITLHVGGQTTTDLLPGIARPARAGDVSELKPRMTDDFHREEPITPAAPAFECAQPDDPGPAEVRASEEEEAWVPPVFQSAFMPEAPLMPEAHLEDEEESRDEAPVAAQSPSIWDVQDEMPPVADPPMAMDEQVEAPVVEEERVSEEAEVDELTSLKARISDGLVNWMRDAENSFRGKGVTVDEEKIRARLLKQVHEICDHAWAVHIGMFATLPNTPDSGGSLAKELQKWAIAQAALRLTRSLDVRAAMQARGSFETVAEDREYLLAIVKKNIADDESGRNMAMAVEYEGRSAPEIAYKLIVSAQRDLSEARMWAEVASLAGDPDFLRRFEDAGSKAFQESLQYWRTRISDMENNPGTLQAAGAAAGPRPGRRISI